MSSWNTLVRSKILPSVKISPSTMTAMMSLAIMVLLTLAVLALLALFNERAEAVSTLGPLL